VPPLQARLHTLENGLEVIVREDHQHPLVSVQIWVKAGSIHEEGWTGAGLAHCVEHMLFKGTLKRSAQEISTGIQKLGGAVNAYTTFNRTVYWIDGLAEHTEGYLDILADMVQHSRLDAAELAKEQEVIRREMAMGNDEPSSQLHHLIQQTCFRTHPLRHPIIGHRAVFDQVQREDVAAFFQRHYVPNNCFVIIAGAVDAEATFAAVERLMGGWQRRPYQPVLFPAEPRQIGPRSAHRDFATELSHVALGWQVPGEGHLDKPVLDVLGFLLGSGRSSRLNLELREKLGIAHSAWAGSWGAQECGVFNMSVECDPQNVPACQQAMLSVVRAMQDKGPRRDELAKTLHATVGGQIRSLATTRGQASLLGHGWLTAGSLDYPRQYLQALSRLSTRQIQDAACRYLQEGTLSTITLGPHAPELADHAQRGPAADAVQLLKLKNGLTLLVQENPRLPLVSIRASFLAGVPAESDAQAGVTQLSAALLLKGTRSRTAAQIATELENRGGGLICQSDAHRYQIGADVMRGDEGAGLELISDLLFHATLPAAELDKVRKRQLAQIQEEKEDPLTVALRRARARLFAGQPFARTALGTETTLAALTVADCRAMLRASLTGSNGVISIVGDVKTSTVRKQVEASLGRLPKGTRRSVETLPVLPLHGITPEQICMEKEQAVLVIGFRSVGLQHPDVHALTLIDEACSDMGSRLFNRIREELGLAYYVGAQQFAALGAGAFYFYVGTDPRKVDLAQAEMLRLIADLAQKGLTPAELTRAKTAWRSQWLRAQQGNGSLADAYAWHEISGLGYDAYKALPEKIAAVSAKDIQRAAQRYLDVKQAVIVRVMPNAAEA
jgi:zinc protease